MRELKLSVIIPTYNREHLIKNAIQQVLEQTYNNIELIVVDDCSTDNTEKNIKSIDDSRIIYIKNDINYGVELSELRAIQQCTGDYITIIADDDKYIDNSFFSEAMELALIESNVDIVSAKAETVYNGNRVKNNFNFNNYDTKDDILLNFNLYIGQFGLGGNSIFKKDLLCRVTNKNQHDYTSIFELIYYAKNIKIINKVVFLWYVSDAIKTESSKDFGDVYKLSQRSFKFIDEVYDFLLINNDLQRFMPFINKYILDSFETIRMNYFLSKNQLFFNKVLDLVDTNKGLYIYGKGFIGLEINNFFKEHNIIISGFIDDNKIESGIVNLNDINSNSQVLIATYKIELTHIIYKKLIASNIKPSNIIELV
jgi:glycosyltransferase involved in cell wall biosynthesis